MVSERLAPGVEHAETADRRAQMFRGGGERAECGRTRLQQQIVDDPFVLQGPPRERMRERADDMVGADREEFVLPGGEPLIARVRQALRAVPIATRVAGEGAMSAGGTAIEMPAHRGGPTALARPQPAEVRRGPPDAMGLDEACAVSTDEVRHLERWPGHRFCSRRVRRTVSACDTGIASSGLATAWRWRCDKCRLDDGVLEFDVPEQALHRAQVGTRFHEVRGLRMA
jgi:hypothetical protein